MSANMAYPGDEVEPFSCGFRHDDGTYCGSPVAYRIEFRGWPSHERAGCCAQHVTEARALDVKRIWSAP